MWKVSSAAWASLEVVEPDFAVEVYPARRAFKIALAISLAGSCITRRGIERTPESADGARNRESRNGPSGQGLHLALSFDGLLTNSPYRQSFKTFSDFVFSS
jgi:hypothetical protein